MSRLQAVSLERGSAIAAIPLGLVGVILTWWGWKSGGYFEVTYLPGTMLLLLMLGALLIGAPWPGRLRGAVLISLLGLIGLAAWTLISATWSTVPDVAIGDTQRALAYVAALVIGIWTALLLGRRLLLALMPIAAAGALVGIATLIALWIGSNALNFFETDTTLRYPIGYRNAEAAFFLMALLPTVVLAASRDLDWRIRGVLIGAGSLMLELAILAQSRGSVFAAVLGVAVLIAVHPDRLRALGWLAMAVWPALVALHWLLGVFESDAGNTPAGIPPLHHACVAMAVTSIAGLAAGCIAARLGRGFELPVRWRNVISRGLIGSLAVALAVGAIALAQAKGGPGGFINSRVKELTAGSPNLEGSSSRFGLDLRTERGDIWRVALDDFVAHPVVGEGSGGFRYTYLLHRRSDVQPEDPHSIELLMASELGLPGILLWGTFAVGAVIAVLRARRNGPSAAALAAGALGMSAYWLGHASVDWFWSYAVITLPVPFALGAAAAPTVRSDQLGGPNRKRTGLAIVCALLALTMIPFFLSARYTDAAIRGSRANLPLAYTYLQRAADLNPWSSRPLAAEAVIATANRDRPRALRSISDGLHRTPDEWILYFLKAKAYGTSNPAGARRALVRARELNPHDPEIDDLAGRLGVRL